ncbi:RNA methyltransferase family protein isoform X2 [Tasmannia lanceolata]|uniref:RNA methyltransferase family protein isoform X2 n=1 Tax=Tasmannia lanceolata TaxID=3420 RepID=UPI004063F758
MNWCIPRITRSTFSLSFLRFTRPKPPFSNQLNRPTSYPCLFSQSSPPLSSSISSKLQIPLFLRPPTSSTTLENLQKWQDWAKNLALSVGSKFLAYDNGPDTELLCREIKWMLEDVVEDFSVISQLGSAQNESMVRLRADLEELYSLWEERIEKRRPFQYIVGCEHWRDLVLSVQEGVLIPRPETEQIVDMVRDVVMKERLMGEGLWADLGTGSGAIGIGIGRILGGGGRVIGTDLSPVAVSVAEFNVQRYGLQDKIEIREGSWFEPLRDVKGKLAGLVSNPPYIPSNQIPGLQAEVGRHEPKIALDGGEDGLDDLLHLSEASASALRPDEW